MRRTALWIMLFIILSFSPTGPAPAQAANYGTISISEIMLDNKDEAPDQWVELYNPGPASIDVSGWVITNNPTWLGDKTGMCILSSGASVPAGGFLVVSLTQTTGLTPVIHCSNPIDQWPSLYKYGDYLALFDGDTTESRMVFGSLVQKFPSLSELYLPPGSSIGLKNPNAGWSSDAHDWNAEITPAGDSTYYTHTAGQKNDGWKEQITTYHTIDVDGSGIDWKVGEYLGMRNIDYVDKWNTNYYITWDAENIYVLMKGDDENVQGYNILIDMDPNQSGSANQGTTAAFCTGTFQEDAKPDYAVQLQPGNPSTLVNYKAKSDGSGWETWPAEHVSAVKLLDEIEFKISRADLDLDPNSPVAFYLYSCSFDNIVYSAWPRENPIGVKYDGTLYSRIYFPDTAENRSPRDHGVRMGSQTLSAATTGSRSYLNDFAVLHVTTAGGPACKVKVSFVANTQITTLGGGVRRAYTVTTSDCSGLGANLTLKYEDGTIHGGEIHFPSELRGLDKEHLILYRFAEGQWNPVNIEIMWPQPLENQITVYYLNEFSTWSFGVGDQPPTAVTLVSFSASSQQPPFSPSIAWLLGLALFSVGMLVVLRRKG
jgi:hypothetical protein